MNSSDTSAKYSWPGRAQKLEIQDSGVPEDVDMLSLDIYVVSRLRYRDGGVGLCGIDRQSQRGRGGVNFSRGGCLSEQRTGCRCEAFAL